MGPNLCSGVEEGPELVCIIMWNGLVYNMCMCFSLVGMVHVDFYHNYFPLMRVQ